MHLPLIFADAQYPIEQVPEVDLPANSPLLAARKQ
jgi:hypothetical protein